MTTNNPFDHTLRALESTKAEARERGLQELNRLADSGHGGALAKLAHFAAAGVNQKPDWDRAIEYLRAAARAGWSQALQELQVLSGTTGPTAVAAPVDIRALVAPRPTEIVSDSPRMRVSPGFLSPAECAWLIARGGGRLERAEVYDVSREGPVVVEDRSNSGAAFRARDIDVVLIFIRARIAHTLGLPQHCFEPTQILHYALGEQFAPHVDYLDSDRPGTADDVAKRGQRVATFLVYLNEDYDGGETAFPRLNLAFKGKTGDALAFANVDTNLRPDPRTLHAGTPPTRGEKWLLSQWIRSQSAV